MEEYFNSGTNDTWYDLHMDDSGNITVIGGYVWLRGLQLTTDKTFSNFKLDTISTKGLFDLELLSNGDLLTVGTDGFLFQKPISEQSWTFHRLANWDILQRVHEGVDAIYTFGGKSNEHGYIYKLNRQFQVDSAMYFPFEISDAIITDERIVAFGWGNIMTSDKNGLQWHLLKNEGDFYASGVMLNNFDGLIIGYNGHILKTVDGGATWHTFKPKIAHAGYNAFRVIKSFDDGTLIICGNDGKFWLSQDQGNSWTYYKLQNEFDIYGCIYLQKNEFALCGEKGTITRIKI
ncbi:MAG: YCF48-related protein [Saprospiraceae bacterium]